MVRADGYEGSSAPLGPRTMVPRGYSHGSVTPGRAHESIPLMVRPRGIIATCVVFLAATCGRPSAGFAAAHSAARAMTVLPQHPVHMLPTERLRKIQKHNPLLLPYHGNHADDPVLAAMPKTLSISPADLGGDPTGEADSTAAVQAAVDRCYQEATSTDPNRTAASGGNCEVFLGGEYLISSPILTPRFENFIFGYGSLVAALNWTAAASDNFLVHNGGNSQRGHYFPELYLDGQHRAGGIRLNDTCAMTIGPGTVVQRFVGQGIYIVGGCECMIDRCWLAELPEAHMHPTATGILIAGNDHDVTNVVVWSMLVGLHIASGGDTMVTGVHNWYPGNIELEIDGQILYLVESGSNRFESCMIDNGKAVFKGGGLTDNIWMNGLEYSDHDVESPHGIMLMGDTIRQFIVQHNHFDHAARIYHVGNATTPTIEDTLIMENTGPGVKASRASLLLRNSTADGSGRLRWFFDFSNKLIFPIHHIRALTPAGWPVGRSSGTKSLEILATDISGYVLTVVTSDAATSVFAEVDASIFTENCA